MATDVGNACWTRQQRSSAPPRVCSEPCVEECLHLFASQTDWHFAGVFFEKYWTGVACAGIQNASGDDFAGQCALAASVPLAAIRPSKRASSALLPPKPHCTSSPFTFTTLTTISEPSSPSHFLPCADLRQANSTTVSLFPCFVFFFTLSYAIYGRLRKAPASLLPRRRTLTANLRTHSSPALPRSLSQP